IDERQLSALAASRAPQSIERRLPSRGIEYAIVDAADQVGQVLRGGESRHCKGCLPTAPNSATTPGPIRRAQQEIGDPTTQGGHDRQFLDLRSSQVPPTSGTLAHFCDASCKCTTRLTHPPANLASIRRRNGGSRASRRRSAENTVGARLAP